MFHHLQSEGDLAPDDKFNNKGQTENDFCHISTILTLINNKIHARKQNPILAFVEREVMYVYNMCIFVCECVNNIDSHLHCEARKSPLRSFWNCYCSCLV